ncbi:MAG: helix-hairpin-helix domain-containing protein [Acidobacteriota bacterium]
MEEKEKVKAEEAQGPGGECCAEAPQSLLRAVAILGAAALGSYLIRTWRAERERAGAGAADPKRPAAAAKSAGAEKEAAPAPSPVRSEPPSELEPDDLRKINGVGPKIASVLEELGFGTFERIADETPERLREALTAVDPRYRIFDPETWPAQAAELAERRGS